MFDADGPEPAPPAPRAVSGKPGLVIPKPHPPRRGRGLRLVTAGLVLAAGTLISPTVAQARSVPERFSSSRPTDSVDPVEDGVAALRVWRSLGLPRARGWYAWQEPAARTIEVDLDQGLAGPRPVGTTATRTFGKVNVNVARNTAATAIDGTHVVRTQEAEAGPNHANTAVRVEPDEDGQGALSGNTLPGWGIDGTYAFAGGRYFNHERRLPEGNRYYEYDVYPRNRGAARDRFRLVVDDTGQSVWFSPNHYLDFYQVA